MGARRGAGGRAPRYDRPLMARFLLLSFTLLLLTMALFAFTLDSFHLLPHTGAVEFGLGRDQMPATTVLATWVLESLALLALFLLVQGRGGTWWLDGIAAGWLAWVFRGPLLVLTVAGSTSLAPQPFWAMALRWLILYSACGLVMAAVARGAGLKR